MRFLKFFFIIAVVGLIGLGLWDFLLAPGTAKRHASRAAQDAANAAAHKYFTERGPDRAYAILSADARAAANATAKAEGATVTAFTIDTPNPVVHVTVSKQSKTLVIQHINGLTAWTEFNASASATPA